MQFLFANLIQSNNLKKQDKAESMGHNDKIQHKQDSNAIHVDLNQIPYIVDRTLPKAVPIFLTVFGLLWSAPPLFKIASKMQHGVLNMEEIVVLGIFLGLGLLILSGAAYLFTAQKIYSFHRNHLELWRKNFIQGEKRHIVPYKQFKGILMDEYVVHRKNQSSITYQTITLIHPDKSLNTLLYEAKGTTPPRDLWKAYIKQLRLPGLQADGQDYNIMHHDDAGLSLRERSKREKKTYYQSETPVSENIPEELDVRHSFESQEESITLRILSNRMTIMMQAIFLLMPLTFLSLPFFTDEAPFIFPLVGFLFSMVVIFLIYQDRTNKRVLKLTRKQIEIDDIALQYQLKHKQGKLLQKISLEQVENILIKRDSNRNKYLAIIGAHGEVSTGTGLSDSALKWLQNYLRKAVVTA